VRHSEPVSQPRRIGRGIPFITQRLRFLGLKFVCFLTIFALVAPAQTPVPGSQKRAPSKAAAERTSHADLAADPPGLLYQGVPAELPQDQGMAGLRLELLRLSTTARLMPSSRSMAGRKAFRYQ